MNERIFKSSQPFFYFIYILILEIQKHQLIKLSLRVFFCSINKKKKKTLIRLSCRFVLIWFLC